MSFRSRDLNPGFLSTIPAHNLNFEGDGMKIKASKLKFLNLSLLHLNFYSYIKISKVNFQCQVIHSILLKMFFF